MNIDKYKIMIFIFIVLYFVINPLIFGQTIKSLYGDTVIIDKFNTAANKMDLDDLTKVQDSFRIRIWNGGNLIDLKFDNNNKIFGDKILYVFSYPKKYRENNYESKMVFEKNNLNKDEFCIIENYIDALKNYNYPDFKINTDSIYRRDGGVGACLELSNSENYLLLSESIWGFKTNQMIDSLFNQLDMPNDHKVFFNKLPNGRRYTTGYTTGIIKLSYFGGLIERLKFWRY